MERKRLALRRHGQLRNSEDWIGLGIAWLRQALDLLCGGGELIRAETDMQRVEWLRKS